MKNILGLIAFLLTIHLQTFAQGAQLVLPIGHTDIVNSITYSPNNRYITTSSNDNTVKIWDAKSGSLLYSLEGHTENITSSIFSPDGNTLVSISDDCTAKIWDAKNGTLLHSLEGHIKEIKSATYSSDGVNIITVSDNNTIKIWNTKAGTLLHSLEGKLRYFTSTTYSPDGEYVIVKSENSIEIWDIVKGKLSHKLKHNNMQAVTISPDGKNILTISSDTFKIWKASDGKLIHSVRQKRVYYNDRIEPTFSSNGKYVVLLSGRGRPEIWDIEKGKFLHYIPKLDVVYMTTFSPDSKSIITSSYNEGPKIWDTETGKLLHSFGGRAGRIMFAIFSPDGRRIATERGIWNTETGQCLVTFWNYRATILSAIFSPNGKSIVTASKDGTIDIWETNTGKIIHTLQGCTIYSKPVTYSPDGKNIAMSSYIWDLETGKLLTTPNAIYGTKSQYGRYIDMNWPSSTAKIRDSESGNILLSLSGGHTESLTSAFFSPDRRRIVTGSFDGTAIIWNAETGDPIHTLHVDESGYVKMAIFSPNGEIIAAISLDKAIQIWDADNGKLLYSLQGHTGFIRTIDFSSDGTSIISSGDDFTIKVWDVDKGKLIHSLKKENWETKPSLSNRDRFVVESATFSPDGGNIIANFKDGSSEIWHTETGEILHLPQEHISNGHAIISPDGKNILIAGNDHRTRVWDAKSKKILYTRLQLTNGDWLVYDEYYRYDGSEGARKKLYFVCGLEVIDLTQMKDALYVPDLVEKIMSGQDINYPKLSDLDICDALPLVERIDDNIKNYYYKITPRRMELEYMEVYINNKKVKSVDKKDLIEKDGIYYLELNENEITQHFINGYKNSVKVEAIVHQNGSELRSRGAVVLVAKNKKTLANPKLFAVMIGINDYKDDALDLNYPAKDATDLGNAIEISAKQLLGDENVFMYKINSNVNGKNGYTTPEKEGIRRALQEIGKKAAPEDVIMLFFAGHGVMQGNKDKLFTFLTAEASASNQVGISTKELQEWLSYEGPHKVLANKTILIFDACNSGQATQELLALARTDDDTRRIRQVEDLKDKSGMFILAASAPNQNAYELPQYEQGLLTYSLLYVLKNNADILDDGKFLNVQKWFLESEEYLQQLVKSMGYDQDAQPFGTANIRIGIVNNKVKNSIQLAEEKPILVCANVMDNSTFDDKLNLKVLINERLLEISERGIKQSIIYSHRETEDANKINIIYTIKEDEIICEVHLVRQGEQLHSTSIKGNKSDLNLLVVKIIDEVMKYVR